MGSADHLQSPLLLVCARTPPSAEVLGLCHHPTARAHKCSNPEIHINLSILKLLTTAITLKAIHEFQKSFKETPPYTERYHYARLLTHIAKNLTADMSSYVTRLAMELHGGIGFLSEFPVERWHREALITPIWEGTSNIQALDMLEAIVKKSLTFRYSKNSKTWPSI